MNLKELLKQKENGPYSDTGKNAPYEVQTAIRRWKDLPPEKREKQPLLYWLLGSGTPEYKMSKGESDYTDRSEVEGQACGNCEFAYLKIANKKFICSQIRGHISPKGWCRLWEPSDETS